MISSYRRIATPAYGGPDRDRRTESVNNIQVSEDGRGVSLELGKLREGFVYKLRLRGLASEASDFIRPKRTTPSAVVRPASASQI